MARTTLSSIAEHLEALQRLPKLMVDCGMFKLCSSGFDHHGEIHFGSNPRPVIPEILAEPALDAVTADSVADLAADTDSQTSPGRTGTCNHDEMCGMATPTLPPDLRILAGRPQATARREAPIRPGIHERKSFGRNGHHQPFAPLGAPPSEYVDAILGAHPQPKTMGPLTANLARLISSFAHGT